MIIIKKTQEINNFLTKKREERTSYGFVPTMGALHDGHISLINLSKKENDLTVCSIFVNPTQFNDKNDFKNYPVTIEDDLYQLEAAGCDVLFTPSVQEIYPQGESNLPKYDLGFLESVYEGKFRPGHFQGVCQVVHCLLQIIQPGILYLGQKDFQQCLVIKKMIELTGLDKKINIKIGPTLRENDGLAMSSRNRRLNESNRKKANSIFKALLYIKTNFEKEAAETLLINARKILEQNSFKVDYIDIADAASLNPVKEIKANQNLIAVVAAYLHDVRLIDNMILN